MTYRKGGFSEADFALAWRLRPESWVWTYAGPHGGVTLDTGVRMEKARRVLVGGEAVNKVEPLGWIDAGMPDHSTGWVGKKELAEICQQTWGQIYGST